ncbi:hypothetical protein ACOZ4J_27315 [Pseudomonas syringae pv. actinidiae]|uniref:hypothetical protein n=1 Tax=Pseudomonas syringae TaxID=317 RepID=UPI003DA8C543
MARPEIAVRRQELARAKYVYKLDYLQRIVEGDADDIFPDKISITKFSEWLSAEEGVEAISRTILYSDEQEYLHMRERLDKLLRMLSENRVKKSKRAGKHKDDAQTIALLQQQVQTFADQYTYSQEQLKSAQLRIHLLEAQINRLKERLPREKLVELVK